MHRKIGLKKKKTANFPGSKINNMSGEKVCF